MIDFLFTIDYEIRGDGSGGLRELVLEPARRLKEVFEKHNARFVNFVEVAELQAIEAHGTDPTIEAVRDQVREFHRDHFEIALHLHPQWANARYADGRWLLDIDEYNLCTLPPARIAQIVDSALGYLRGVVGQADFTPLSFRAGNWLFQPTSAAARVLSERGIRIDSSVFKGGCQRNYQLDYRPARKNGYFWSFGDDVNRPDPMGQWVEVPIHTDMVPFWKMAATKKRMGLKGSYGVSSRSMRTRVGRTLDFLRPFYPLKLDFCRMTLEQLTATMNRLIREDQSDRATYRPIVAIGHTKDLTDFECVDSFLAFLTEKRVRVCTFPEIYPKIAPKASLEGLRQATATAIEASIN